MKNKGFTLVEVLAIISIMGVIIILFSPAMLHVFSGAKNKINSYAKEDLLDGAKMYLMDLDNDLVTYRLPEAENINGTDYAKNDEISGYDLKTYIISHNGINVDIQTLVKGGYFDSKCDYEKSPKKCKVLKTCSIHLTIKSKLHEETNLYETVGYDAEIVDESKC